MTTQNLSATGQRVIYGFDTAAREWGVADAHATRETRDKFQKIYESNKNALDAYVLGLERKIRRLKDELKRTKDDQRGALSLALTKRMVIDITTARAAIDEAFDQQARSRGLPDPSGQ